MLITHGTTADVTVPCTSIMMFGVNFIYSFFRTEYCQSIICYNNIIEIILIFPVTCLGGLGY